MSLLVDLINSISREEFVKVKNNLKLIGKEKVVFDFIIENPKKTKNEALNALNLSSVHFDKINTVLLRKCYKLLCQHGDLLFYLNQRHLVKHLLHEIKIRGKIISELSPPILKSYFDYVVNVPAKYFNETNALKLGIRFIEISDDKINVEAYVMCRLLYTRLNFVRHGKPSGELKKKILIDIEKLKSLHTSPLINAETNLWIFKTLAFFYIRIDKEMTQHIFYLEKIKQLFANNNDLSLKEKAINDCNIASHYYDTNELIKAQKLYQETFSKYSLLLISEVRHIARFIELCIILNDINKAEAIYRKWLRIFLKTEHEAFGVLACIVNSKILIYNLKYKEALKIIQKGKNLNSRSIYYKYDVELRMLENILFALRKDYHFALELAHKNLKFISSQGISLKKYMHAHYFKLIIHYINHKVDKIPIPVQVIKYYREYQQGELIIYGQLLKLLQ